MFLDATYCEARLPGLNGTTRGGRVASRAVIIATAVSRDGRREVLGCAVGDSETGGFWTEFLRSLRDRGLSGVQLVISDCHRGLVNAVNAVFLGAAWQRRLGGLVGSSEARKTPAMMPSNHMKRKL